MTYAPMLQYILSMAQSCDIQCRIMSRTDDQNRFSPTIHAVREEDTQLRSHRCFGTSASQWWSREQSQKVPNCKGPTEKYKNALSKTGMALS